MKKFLTHTLPCAIGLSLFLAPIGILCSFLFGAGWIWGAAAGFVFALYIGHIWPEKGGRVVVQDEDVERDLNAESYDDPTRAHQPGNRWNGML